VDRKKLAETLKHSLDLAASEDEAILVEARQNG
jgi:hypothetical protein